MARLSLAEKHKLLVYGYVRSQNSNSKKLQLDSLDIPEDIIDLFFLWYHINSFFFKAGDYCTIN